jgi:hypothetical protein
MFFLTDLFVISRLLCSWKELAASLDQKCGKLLLIGDALRHQIVVCGAAPEYAAAWCAACALFLD